MSCLEARGQRVDLSENLSNLLATLNRLIVPTGTPHVSDVGQMYVEVFQILLGCHLEPAGMVSMAQSHKYGIVISLPF